MFSFVPYCKVVSLLGIFSLERGGSLFGFFFEMDLRCIDLWYPTPLLVPDDVRKVIYSFLFDHLNSWNNGV